MPDDVVTTAGQTVVIEIPGTDRKYTLRAPTFGEVGAMAARAAGTPVPSDAIFVDVLRDALRAADMDDGERAAHLAALDAAEEAADALDSLYAVHGVDRKAWDADARREIADADRVYRAAQKRRAKAEWAVRDAESLAVLRRHQMDAGRREQVEVVALCLTVQVDVDALPAGDVLTIYQRAMTLMRPSAAAEKN